MARDFFSVVILTWIWRTLVKCHHDIRTYDALGIYHILGRELMLRAIYMTAKLGPFFFYLANIR
jgi:hypothetical protein